MRSFPLAGIVLIICAAGCQGWKVQPVSLAALTLVPSGTPVIDSPTARLVTPTQALSTTASMTPAEPTSTSSPEAPQQQSATPTAGLRVAAEILACGEGLDLAHGMGQVTDAYVSITNSGSLDAETLCATLRGLHESQVHPDKTQCVANLPAGYQVTLKLTIDSSAVQSTAIQVEITANDALLLRLGKSGCEGPVLIPRQLGSLKTPQPIP